MPLRPFQHYLFRVGETFKTRMIEVCYNMCFHYCEQIQKKLLCFDVTGEIAAHLLLKK